MTTQRYSVTPYAIDVLLGWVKSGEIAIPEIQRPFVWEAVKVRNLLDSLYRGYPVGYLIAWRNPNVKLKDGTTSAGKRILIDGQQRVTALMAAILGQEVLNKHYDQIRIKIAFHPQNEAFEVTNPAIARDPAWIADVGTVFHPDTSLMDLIDQYSDKNPQADRRQVGRILETLRGIIHNHIGVIELAGDLDIETVTEIFIRVNSAGMELSQADFVMSKIAVNESYGGRLLRKAIDYFCLLAVHPEDLKKVENDKTFADSEFLQPMRWLGTTKEDIYDPTYTDMLRVAFTSEFGRGRLQDLVALLSGRNFETKQYEERIVEESFNKLRTGMLAFMRQTHFERFTMIISSAGFLDGSMIFGQNTLNFAYVLYLRGRAQKVNASDLERLVRRWYAMSLLTGRFSGSSESAFDSDIRQIEAMGLQPFAQMVMETELPESFWTGMLPQNLMTSSVKSPFFLCYQAAQAKLGDLGFLSRDITVRDLLLNRSDVHHVFPKKILKNQGLPPSKYNQIANYVLAQSEINIAIGATPPETYFTQLGEQCNGGPQKYGGITDPDEMRANLIANALPQTLLTDPIPDYETFLQTRRHLMAQKLKTWFEAL